MKRSEIHVEASIADLVPEYLARVSADIGQIDELARLGKVEEILKIGHNLKGSGGAYGFVEITRLGNLIESSARTGMVSAAESAAEALKNYIRDVKWDSRD